MIQVIAVFLLAHVAAGVSLHSDVSIMRRESTVGSHGEMVFKNAASMTGTDTCNDFFSEGKEAKQGKPAACKNPSHERLIDQSMKELCVVAARGKAGKDFVVGYTHYNESLPGCFKDETTGKYYYNQVYQADPSQIPKGTPICITKKFMTGTANENTCPDDYVAITSEAECRYAATCMSSCKNGQFNKATTSAPKGCYISDDKCYGFNPGEAPAEGIKGTPVCRDKKAPPFKDSSLAAVSGSVLEVDSIVVQDKEASNPCSYLGCNSAKCEWASGGRIRRVEAAKACSNALVLGSSDSISNTTSTGGTPLVKIETLKQCMHAVKARQDDACSGHFQMHKETWTCSCVPAGSTCSEKKDNQVCRFEVVD